MSWDFRPLKITVHLTNSVCGNDPFFPLDGVIMLQVLMEEYGPAFWELPDPKERLVYPQPESMPLAVRHAGQGYWYYACSFAFYETLAEELQYWHKRARANQEQYLDFGGRRGKIDDATGPFRAYRVPLRTFVTPKLIWYAVGDRKAVKDYLRRVNHLGKKRAYGNGEVRRWEVETVDHDWSEQLDGTWTRAVPVASLSHHLMNMTYHSFRPPYWHKANFALCCMPGTKIKPEVNDET